MAKLDLSIFDLSPIPMWLQDFSGVRRIFDEWTAQGITDIKQYLLEDPNRFRPCLATIETVHINQSTRDESLKRANQKMYKKKTKYYHEKLNQAKFN